ncbi:MAG TPA: hypothetical protein VFP68_00350 [Burkholderiaceae bacterium]|nr:hypothetical protein [Burkholderiaceae bacterium]
MKHVPLPMLIAAVLAALAGRAAAEANPYSLGVSQAFTRDSNIFRAPDNFERVSDTISSTGLLGAVDQPFGRQRFYANGLVRYNKYMDHDELNNAGYSLSTGLDWSTINRLSGRLYYAVDRSLANYNSTSNTVIDFRGKNLQKTQQFDAAVQYGLVALLSLEAGYNHHSIDYSAALFAPSNFRQDAFSGGLKYRPSGALTLGAGLRTTRGKYPDRPQEVRFRRNDIDLTAEWVASGLSTFNARLSYGRIRYANDIGPDFNAVTGTASWDYRPTGKLRFTTSVSRDTGQETRFYSPVLGDIRSATNSRLTTAGQLRALYDVTAKIQLYGAGAYARRTINGIPNLGDQGHDRTRSLGAGVKWLPLRSLQLACDLTREVRSTDLGIQSGITYPYHVNTAGCSAQLTLH